MRLVIRLYYKHEWRRTYCELKKKVLEWWRVKCITDIERHKLIEEGKRMGINEIIAQNKIINSNL